MAALPLAFHDPFVIMFRTFFILCAIVDLVFVYAILFDRDLPRRMANRFFGLLLGQRIDPLPPSDPDVLTWGQLIIFIFALLSPVALWVAFEWLAAAHGL